MKRFGLLIGFLALAVILSSGVAQDEKKKDADKDGKDEEKKKPDAPPAKEKKQIEKMPAYGTMFRTKIISANGATSREFTVEVKEQDPKKIQELAVWRAQRQQQLAQALFNLNRATNFQQRITQKATYDRDVANFQIELAKRSQNIYSTRPLDVRAHEEAKVRTMYLPVQFDDQGFQKKWTEKEKKEFRGDTQLPGYPSDFDAIKSGQYVDIYMAKRPVATKKKKGADDDPVEMSTTPEFVLIVIIQDGK